MGVSRTSLNVPGKWVVWKVSRLSSLRTTTVVNTIIGAGAILNGVAPKSENRQLPTAPAGIGQIRLELPGGCNIGRAPSIGYSFCDATAQIGPILLDGRWESSGTVNAFTRISL